MKATLKISTTQNEDYPKNEDDPKFKDDPNTEDMSV